MNLKCETILDFYTHKNRKIFCQIKVLHSKCHKIKNTCRSLTSDQWTTFDKELEKLLDGFESSDDGNKENLGKFIIKPNIEVKVRKSKLSLKYFCKFVSISGDCEKDYSGNTEDNNGIAIVLECMLDLQHEAIFALSYKPQEYEPSLDGKLSSSLTYEPYTPSKAKNCADNKDMRKTSGVDFLNYNEDTYSPKPLFETTTTQSLNEMIPKYKPAPIIENVKSKTKVDLFAQKLKEEYIPEAQKMSTFSIPAYVPTPIDWSSTEKAIKLFYEKPKTNFENKKLRKRSKTIDTMPKDFAIGIFCNQKAKQFSTKIVEPLNENILKCKHIHIRDNRSSRDSDISHSKCTNEFINETDDEIVPSQNYRPLRLKPKKNITNENEIDIKSKCNESLVEDMQKNIRIDKDVANNKRIDEINILPEILSDSSKKSSKTIDSIPKELEIDCYKKSSKTIDSMPKELETDNEKLKIKTTLEENKKNLEFKNHKSKEKKNESNEVCIPPNVRDIKSGTKPTKVLRSTSSSEDENSPKFYKRTKKETKSDSKESNNNFEYAAKINKRKYLNEPEMSPSELSGSDNALPTTDKQRGKKSEQPTTSLRRSDRSPSKPKRFLEEISGIDSKQQKKPKIVKTSSKNKELFGSDDDDDEDVKDFENNNTSIAKKNVTATVFETPIRKNHTKCASSSSSSSSKNKRKVDRSSDCEQEKRDLNKWLSKKKTSIQDPDAATLKVSKKSQSSKSPLTKSSKKSKTSKTLVGSKEACNESLTPTCQNYDMPSKKELEEIRNKSKLKQKENEKLKAELDKMRVTPPKKIENLSLHDMSANEILDTFTTYKSELDNIYKKNCKRDYIKGHDGINHCFVIQLLQQNVQMKMLQKLTDVYSNSNHTMQATLYANALLPEWVIRVYMDKFKFTRQEAINQIKAQDDYRLHMEEQSDGSFIFN